MTEQLSFFGFDPEETARRQAAIAARLLELALDQMYGTDSGSDEQ